MNTTNNEIFLFIIKDRHEDITTHCYSTYEQALKNFENYKIKLMPSIRYDDDYTDEFDPNMGYYLKFLAYDNEGDCIYIIKSTIDKDIE